MHIDYMQDSWYYLTSSTSMFTKLIQIAQIYEWLSMKQIIIWQSTKDFTEAMLQIKDPEAFSSFLRKELRLKVLFILF